MGYRSEVKISISKPAMAYCIVTGVVFPTIFEDAIREKLEFNEVFIFDNIKWYESYPEIKEVGAFLQMLDDAHDEIPPLNPDDLPHWALVRVGEDHSDLEISEAAQEHGLYAFHGIDHEHGLNAYYIKEIKHASTQL